MKIQQNNLGNKTIKKKVSTSTGEITLTELETWEKKRNRIVRNSVPKHVH